MHPRKINFVDGRTIKTTATRRMNDLNGEILLKHETDPEEAGVSPSSGALRSLWRGPKKY